MVLTCPKTCINTGTQGTAAGRIVQDEGLTFRCDRASQLRCVHPGPQIHGAQLFAAASLEVAEELGAVGGVAAEDQVHEDSAAGRFGAEHIDFSAEVGFGPFAEMRRYSSACFWMAATDCSKFMALAAASAGSRRRREPAD